jgi:two-component sensor histidine kinase/Tfp pilus assembly protein PilF
LKKFFLFLLFISSQHISAQALKTVEHSWEIFGENMDSAKYLVEKGYEEAQQESDLKAMGRALCYRAIYYDIDGRADSALFLFFKALSIQESIHDTEGLVVTYNNLGIFNFSQYQYPQALTYYKKAYAYAMLLKNYSSAAGSLVNMGVIESYNPNGGRALKYYEEAEKLYRLDGDSAALPPLWSNKAKIYLNQGNYSKAYEYNLKSVKLNDDYKTMASWLTERILMANILIKMKRWNEAEKYGLEGLKVAEQNHLPERKQYLYESLSNVYFGMGNYKKAFEFTSKYRDLRDSLINESRAAQVAEMEVKYRTERNINEINALKLEASEKKNIKLQKEQLQTGLYILVIGGGIGFVVFIILIVLLILTISLEKKNTRLQSEKKDQTEALLEQEKILMRESHHRIKNNLQLVNSILDLQSRSIEDAGVKKIFAESRQRIQAISFAHQRLQGNDTVEKLNLKSFLSDLIQSIQSSSLDVHSEILVETHIEEVIISTEKAVPIGLIVNELFTNAIKYAFGTKNSGTVKITLKKETGRLELEISDNGQGIQGNAKDGFGHQLIKSMIRQLKAEYFLSLEPGVQHRFLIPLV